LDAVADGGGTRGFEIEFSLEGARAIGMAGREVEEGGPTRAPLTCRALVEWTGSLDYGGAADGDRRDERRLGLERELRSPGSIGFVIPMDCARSGGRGHRHRAGPHAGDI